MNAERRERILEKVAFGNIPGAPKLIGTMVAKKAIGAAAGPFMLPLTAIDGAATLASAAERKSAELARSHGLGWEKAINNPGTIQRAWDPVGTARPNASVVKPMGVSTRVGP